jgi:hypothetical protein
LRALIVFGCLFGFSERSAKIGRGAQAAVTQAGGCQIGFASGQAVVDYITLGWPAVQRLIDARSVE